MGDGPARHIARTKPRQETESKESGINNRPMLTIENMSAKQYAHHSDLQWTRAKTWC